MDYRIAIPSFNRPQILIDKTLKLLDKHGIPFNKIDLFLENQEQYDNYIEVLEKDNRFWDIDIHITDTLGIGMKRNYIRYYYVYETNYINILSIDDDIECIMKMDNEIDNLDEFIKNAFIETKKRGYNLWGVSAYHNPFFLSDKISINLKYICGAFFGLIIDRSKVLLQTNYNHYEDFQFSILHFCRDKGVVRFNMVAIKTKYFGEGGINESYGGLANRKKDMEIAGKRFVEEYPTYSRLIEKKYGYDIRLRYTAKPPVN